MPVEMSSRADIRVAGDSFFTMTYDYTMINGQSIADKAVNRTMPRPDITATRTE